MTTPTSILGSTGALARVPCERLAKRFAKHGASFDARERDPKTSISLAAKASW